MAVRKNPEAVAPPLGAYSHAVMTDPDKSLVYISGQVGIAPDGTIPQGIEAQTEIVWQNITAILDAHDLTVGHLIKINSYLVNVEDIPVFGSGRARFLGDAAPASTLIAGVKLVSAALLVEVDAVAEIN